MAKGDSIDRIVTMTERAEGYSKDLSKKFSFLTELQQAFNENFDKYTEETKRLFKVLGSQGENTLKLFEKSFEDLTDAATKGNKAAKDLLEFQKTKQYTLTKELNERAKRGEELTKKQRKDLVEGMHKIASMGEAAGAVFKVNVGEILEKQFATIQDSNLSPEERKHAANQLMESVNLLRKTVELSQDQETTIKKLRKVLESGNFTEEENSKKLNEISTTLLDSKIKQQQMVVGVEQLQKISDEDISTSEELLKIAKHQKLDKEREKTSLVSKNIKAGGVEFFLSQIGLAGLGIGDFITDTERMSLAAKKVGKGLAMFANLGVFIAKGLKLDKAAKKIKDFSMLTFESLKKLGTKLGDVGSDIFENIKRSGKSLTKLMRGAFEGIGEGFKKFWKDGLKAMQGGGLIGKLFSGLLSGGKFLGSLAGSAVSGLGGLAGKAGGALLGGAGKLLGGAGGLVGKGIKGAGRLLGKAGKFLPGIGLAIGAGMAGMDFYGGYKDAANISGKKKEKLTTGDKIQAGFSKMLSGLTFDMVDAKTIYSVIEKGIDFMFGKEGIFTKAKDFFMGIWNKLDISSIMGMFSDLGTKIGEFFSIDKFKDIFSKISDAIKQIFSGDAIIDGIKNFVTSIFELVKTAFLELTPGGALLKKGMEAVKSGGFLSNLFGGGETPTNGIQPGSQMSTPQPTGNVDVNSKGSRQMVKDGFAAQQATANQTTQTTGSPANTTVVSPESRAPSGARVTKVDDLGLATLNSILFE